jgi:quercetin dioxygenase-like cupin family protein
MNLQIKNYLNSTGWTPMVGSGASGLPLVKHNNFAADILHFQPNTQTVLHTHPGNHILFVADGSGWLLFDDNLHTLSPGDCYFVPGDTPHQVGTNETTLYLLSIADDHRPVDSPERLQEVTPHA